MKSILLLTFLSLTLLTTAQGQISVAPKKIMFGNSALIYGWSNDTVLIDETKQSFSALHFGYKLQISSKLSVAEIHRQVASLVKKLKPAVEFWKNRNPEWVRMQSWNFYAITISLKGPDKAYEDLFGYEVNYSGDSLVSKLPLFSSDYEASKFKFVYSSDYLTKITGKSFAARFAIYDSIRKTMHACALKKVPGMLRAFDEKPPTKDEEEYWYRSGKRHHYRTCFRELIKPFFKTNNPEILDALHIEMGLCFGDEQDYEGWDL